MRSNTPAFTKLISSVDGNLHSAVNNKSLVVDLEAALIKDSTAINNKFTVGFTALMMFVCLYHEKFVQIVKLLIEHGADPNITNDAGETALGIAAKYGNAACVKLLLANRANINHLNVNSETPLMMTLLASYDNIECIRLLIAAGANVNIARRDAFTPLMCASIYRSEEVVSLLINGGADVNQRDSSGETALTLATRASKPSVVALLSGSQL